LENVHDEAVENMPVLRSEGIQTVENDEFDIIVGFLNDEVYETRCGS
jgi:hypothetical protein